MGSPVRIAVLGWSDTLAEYGLFLLMAFLTKWWEFRTAAAIVNVFWGITAILPIAIKLIKNRKQIPDRWMALSSSLVYILGLGLLSFSASKTDANSKVGVRDKTLLFTSLPLIAVAKSGYAVTLQKFITDEIGGVFDQVNDLSLSIGVGFLVNIVGLAISYAMATWRIRFEIPAWCMVAATLIFLTGFCSYGQNTIQEPSLFTKVYEQIHKLLTIIIDFTTDMLDLFMKLALCPLRIFCCHFFKKEKKTQEELSSEQHNNDTILRKEETKFIISLFPLCLLGLVSSLGNTYFLEQAYSMNQNIIGDFKVPFVLLLSMYKLAKFLFPKIYFELVDGWIPSGCTCLRKALNRIGMALSLLFSLLCCIIASIVERKRLHLLHSNDEKLHILSIVPQFFLLGGFYGMAYESIERFFKDHEIPPSLKPYMVDSAVGVFGLGNIGNVLLVFLVSRITSKNGTSWFKEKIDDSHLDKYYWLVSVWIAINIVWYLLVSLFYRPKEKPTTSTRSLDEEEEKSHTLKKMANKYCLFLKCLPKKVPDCCCCCCCCCCCPSNINSDPKQELGIVSRVVM